jgi:hypothetical protein
MAWKVQTQTFFHYIYISAVKLMIVPKGYWACSQTVMGKVKKTVPQTDESGDQKPL